MARKKKLSPYEARRIAWTVYLLSAFWIASAIWPQQFKLISDIIGPVSLIALAGLFVTALIELPLLHWFGARDECGLIPDYVDPTTARIERIETAIYRLAEEIEKLDPEIAEELRLRDVFLRGEGSMFAGMDHLEYTEARRAAGKRLSGDIHREIWRE